MSVRCATGRKCRVHWTNVSTQCNGEEEVRGTLDQCQYAVQRGGSAGYTGPMSVCSATGRKCGYTGTKSVRSATGRKCGVHWTNVSTLFNGEKVRGTLDQCQYAVQRGECARHRETNRFNLAVTVAPQSKVSFNLTYQELLKRTRGHYEQVIYIDPGQPVPDMDITVAIVESREITDLRVPPLRNDVMADIEDVSTITVITTPTPKTAHVKFVPSIEFQTAQSASGMAGQFVVQYDVEREMDIGDVLVVNGYFVHFFAPDGYKPIPNDVLFILDTSGSMTGTKLNQLKQAMHSILGQLNEGDRMNIMSFSGSTSFWKTQMVDVLDEDIMEEAKTHISSLKAGGWTNIDLALTTGVTFLKDRSNTDGAVRSPVIVFLTDGEATHGVTNTEEILKNVRTINEIGIPVFSLAFGEHADYDLVKKVSIQNNGLGRKIYEASDAAMQISGFYNEISVTLLNNITFQYLDAPVVNVTKHEYTNYFNGSEMVISGRLENLDDFVIDNTLTLRIISNSVDGPHMVLSGGLSDNLIDISVTENATNSGDFEKITEKVWAYLTIKQLLDKELATSDEAEKQGYNRQILELSLKYGFVTPLTSMVVTLPDTDSTENIEDVTVENNQERRPVPKPGQFRPGQRIHHKRPYSRKRPYSSMPAQATSKTVGSNFMRTQFSSPMRVFSDPADMDVAYDIIDPLASLGKFGSDPNRRPMKNKRRNKHKKNKRKNRNKNKRRNQKKPKGFQYPLRVKFPKLADPLCFSMYDDALETAPDTYVFYSDNDTGLQLNVLLEKTILGKWTKQGSVKEIHMTSGEHHEQLTSETFNTKNVSTGDVLPWEVTFLPAGNASGPARELKVKLDAFVMSVTVNDDGYLNLMVEKSSQSTLADTGILSQVLAKKVHMIKIIQKPAKTNKKGKKKPAKDKVILKIDGTKFVLKSRQIESPGTGTEKCWPLAQQEAKLVDTKSARVI
ncbi:inter-alpha-trypsin inhibitor heavy chain H3-like isoform X2 [Mercenaria mercenaria]|uniref:inter-alpha-trypsin inhibitor heavy chain H3-like isoform X2 n=1 Tax=Mercenaria mercenaria TaxID=6596 RepID=UPI00234F04B1|nr:inter-alpha-trypsin inhibitor heavy chain H3-like isoform X2 [Mercenaria mercenaria]